MIHRLSRGAALAAFSLLLVSCGGDKTAPPPSPAGLPEELWHHRNLGKAFYENPATQYEAVGELEKALALNPDSVCERVNYGLALVRAGQEAEGTTELERAQAQDPTLPHTWFNLGIAYKRASDYERAKVQFERMVELVPDEPISHYNLATLYKLEDRPEDAVRHFERAAELDPNLAGPHFQLAALYRQLGRADAAKAATARFRELKAQNEGAAVPEDLEWSFYSELCETIDPENAVTTLPAVDLVLEPTVLASGFNPVRSGVSVLDLGGDSSLEVLAWTESGVRVFTAAGEEVDVGLGDVAGIRDITPGDVDNDGLADLAVVRDGGAALYLQKGGAFHPDASAAWPDGTYNDALWLDYDHDYDLDLVLLGAASRLVGNDGVPPGRDAPAWSDRTAKFPFSPGEAVAGVVFDLVPDTQGMDLAVVYAGAPAVLYRDRLAGKYDAEPFSAIPAGTLRLAALDVDHDGRTDLVGEGPGGLAVLGNKHGGFTASAASPESSPFFADFSNRGLPDFLTSESRVGAAADLDADGRVDLVAVSPDGDLALSLNRTESAGHWIGVALEGTKNPKLAPGAEVEVKAGRLYRKKTYRGVPLHFGLGTHAEVDTVRITWPNGLIQNEAHQPADALHRYPEAQRLSGSCPMIYTWNGEGFQFISDVLGVAPLGASSGDGETFPVDHDEHIQIPGEALAVTDDGSYEIRVVEELREVAFVDEFRLIAVDHPEDVEIFVNDKFQAPPFPELELYGVRERFYPVTALDHHGHDVRLKLLARDRDYPDDYARDRAGVAEMHSLVLDFGPVAAANRAVLVMSGWVDWADGSTFLATSQTPGGALVTPSLEVKDADGQWRTVLPDMGMPAGKPKTIVVDLEGKFLSASREVRITTNVCVYWDEVFLAENAKAPDVTLRPLRPKEATLRFAGFSRVELHPERKQPERFVYAERRGTAMWNPTPGLYTRYGDVRPLLTEVDDRFVVMGSGDEVRLLFDAHALPPPAPGTRRDFLLKVDGWAKDGDANTIYSQTVEPLPFHGMPAYPYAPPHAYPDTEEHRGYRETYNTRPALRLIRPLNEGTP